MKNHNEKLLYEILNEAFPGKWVSEFKGIKDRQFRFDAANPTDKVCIEVEGGIWLGSKGGHTSGIGYEQNLEKYNLAVINGWQLLRYSPSTLKKHPEQIILDVMALTGCKPTKIITRNTTRAKVANQTKIGSMQVKIC